MTIRINVPTPTWCMYLFGPQVKVYLPPKCMYPPKIESYQLTAERGEDKSYWLTGANPLRRAREKQSEKINIRRNH